MLGSLLNVPQKTMNKFYVLVGSNIEPQENIKKGLNLIKETNKIILEAVSNEHISQAVGMDSDDFLNLALRCTTSLNFIDTRNLLKDIETSCGRERDPSNKFTPRTLDLDIIIWNDFEGIIDGYQLPDPDINKYDFIQKPLAEILN